MSSDIIVAQMSTKDVQFIRSQSGKQIKFNHSLKLRGASRKSCHSYFHLWILGWIFREDKREMVGPFQADVYLVQGITLESQKRREHLSEEDLIKNKEALVETFTKPSASSFELNGMVRKMASNFIGVNIIWTIIALDF